MTNRTFESGPAFRTVIVDNVEINIKAVDHDFVFINHGQENPIPVRGIPHSAITHVKVDVDGGVALDERHGITSRRLDTFATASPAAIRRLGEICLQAAEIFITDYKEDLMTAHAAQLSNSIMRLDREVSDLTHQIEMKVREREDLLRAEQEINNDYTPKM